MRTFGSRPRRSAGLLLAGMVVVIAMAGSMIASGDSLPTARDVFADKANESTKADLEAEDALLQQIGEANPAPAPDDPESAGPKLDTDDLEFETGIFTDVEFPGGSFEFVNYWNGVAEGWNVTVFAGAFAADKNSAVVLVKLSDPLTAGSKFEGPIQANILGPLTITSYKGATLTLTGPNGDQVTFDALSRTFGTA